MISKGIEHVNTPPNAHAQNGRVERVHLTVLNGVRTVLTHCGLGPEFWAEAANYIAYTRNRTPCGPEHKIPDDCWRNKLNRHDHLQPFGCKVFYRDHRQINKLQPRYKEALLMGYQDGTHNYRVWDVNTKSIATTRDVVFTDVKPISSTNAPILDPEVISVDSSTSAPSDQPVRRIHLRLPQQVPQLEEIIYVQAPQNPQQQPAGEEEIDNPLNPLDIGGRNPQSLVAHAHTVDSLPISYIQARNSGEWDQWEPAMKDEMAKMEKYKVWDVIPRQSHMRVVGARWVYTRKIDGETGKPSAYKARWVAKGFSQLEGVDFDELFAAVAHKDSIRVFLALVNHLDLECDQIDIKAAFLNGDLEETIYLAPPEGSNIASNKVLLLRKSLYGLRQSPRCFNKAFDKWLREQGFVPTTADPCIYTRRNGSDFIMLSLHVDDQLIACNNRFVLDKFKSDLNTKFECSDSGPAGYFLGFNIHREPQLRKLYIKNTIWKLYSKNMISSNVIQLVIHFHQAFNRFRLQTRNSHSQIIDRIRKLLALYFTLLRYPDLTWLTLRVFIAIYQQMERATLGRSKAFTPLHSRYIRYLSYLYKRIRQTHCSRICRCRLGRRS